VFLSAIGLLDRPQWLQPVLLQFEIFLLHKVVLVQWNQAQSITLYLF
jgi:hypothetical protein